MQQELRFATFNTLNLAPPGVPFYADQDAYTPAEYEAKIAWTAQQLDLLDADVIGFQEIFSQGALRDVLARTRLYRTAHHIGFDPVGLDNAEACVKAGTLTPSVALVSRLPLAGTPSNHTKLPHGLAIDLPGIDTPVTTFTRPILHAQVMGGTDEPSLPGRPLPRPQAIDVFVCHLKSKRPDYRSEISASSSLVSGVSGGAATGINTGFNIGAGGASNEHDSYQLGSAMLRSMIRRGAEALGLRYLISDQLRRQRLPLVVLGDFNDVAGAITTQIVTGTGSERRNLREGPTDRLFDAYRIQSRTRPLRDVGYTHTRDSVIETIDHILVSNAFEPGSPSAIGEVLEVFYINDHLGLKLPEASDHGLVLARMMLFGAPLI